MPKLFQRAAAGQQYAIVVGLIGVVALFAVTQMGGGVRNLMTNTANTMSQAVNGTISGGTSGGEGGGGGGGPVVTRSCTTIKDSNPAAVSGVFNIDPDGAGPIAAMDVYCDMSSDFGGWTLVMRGYGTDLSGWSTLTEKNPGNASLGPAQTTSFRLSDAKINAIRGASGIYRLSSSGAYSSTRFWAAYTYAHETQPSGAGVVSYGTASLGGTIRTGAQTNDCRGLSDFPSPGLFFVTNRCSSTDEYWIGDGTSYLSPARGNSNGHFTMWVRDRSGP